MKKTVAQRITELSQKKSISYYRIADRADLPISTLTNLVNGKTKNPTIETLHSICKGLDVSIQEFFQEM